MLLFLTRSGSKVLSAEGGLSGTLVVLGDRNFVYHDADFVLFGLTAEEIRWLQSGVVVPYDTGRPPQRRRHLRQWARRERRAQTRHYGPGSCKKGLGCPSRCHLRRPRAATTMVCSSPTTGSPGGPSKGFSRHPLYSVSKRR